MLITILKERELDFDDKFVETKELGLSLSFEYGDAIKSHNKATLLAVVEEIEAEIEKKKMNVNAFVDGSREEMGAKMYNQSSHDIQSILNEFKKELV